MKKAPLRVDKIWAVISVDADGDEALVAKTSPEGQLCAIVSVNPNDLKELEFIAKDYQHKRQSVAFVREFVIEDNPEG